MAKERDVRGRFKVNALGSFRNQPIFGQTDTETRKPDKIPVIVLPARRTIVNVYRLLPKGKASIAKIMKGGKSKVAASTISGRESSRPSHEVFRMQINESSVPTGKVIDGEELNIFGLPVYDMKKYPKGDARATSAYKSLATQFVKKQVMKPEHDAIYDEYAVKLNVMPTKMKKTAKEAAEEEEKVRETVRTDHMSAQKEAQKKVFEAHKNDPLYILWKSSRDNKIPMQPNVSKVENDERYRYYNPIDDFALIKRFIEAAKSNKDLPPKDIKNSPIIAISPTLSRPPTAYYVIDSVRAYARKKKHTTSKVRRILKMPKLAFRGTSKKRKIVMKRKGRK